MNFIDKLEKMPESVKVFFKSDVFAFDFEKSCFMYGVKIENIQNISSEISLIFVRDLKLNSLPEIISKNLNLEKNVAYGLAYELNNRIYNRFPDYFTDSQALLNEWEKLKSSPVVSEDEAWKKVLEIEPWILESEKDDEEEVMPKKIISSVNKNENLPIQNALKKYPELGEQLITDSRISLKNFPDPARPSINNWLTDYAFAVGHENHDAMKRGIYLFQNENAKKLSSFERQRLAYILKAHDENLEVEINPAIKQIIFPKNEPSHPEPQTASVPAEKKMESPQVSSFLSKNILPQDKPRIPSGPSVSSDYPKINFSARPKEQFSFSSPQKMPSERLFEKSAPEEKPIPRTPQPIRIAPSGFRRDENFTPLPKNVNPKNVVNLKDNS